MALAEPRIVVPLRSGADQRASPRFGVEMPLQVEGRETTTHDLSTSGLSFESDRSYEPGERVTVVIEYLLDGHNYPLKCEVEVARVQPHDGRFLVGARLVEPLAPPAPRAGA
jgi:hypothetical protein